MNRFVLEKFSTRVLSSFHRTPPDGPQAAVQTSFKITMVDPRLT